MGRREIPSHVRTFSLTRVSRAATTYHLHPDGGHSGWALATVNDETLELLIQSDWGNWSHRWPAGGMATGADGRRCTLTEFLADRDAGHCNYVADKLVSYAERNEFSPERTAKELQRLLCENRLEQGRALLDNYKGEDDAPDVGTDEPPRWCMEHRTVRLAYTYRDEQWPLTKPLARRLFDELDDIKHTDDVRDFVAAFYKIEGHEWIGDGVEFEHLRYEPSCHYYQLLHGILPALVRACAAEVDRRNETAAKVARNDECDCGRCRPCPPGFLCTHEVPCPGAGR